MPFFVFDKVILAFQENNDTIFYVLLYTSTTRKDAGVVDRDGLENRCTGNRTEGSNPSLSANKGVNQQVVRFAPFIMPKKFLGISTDPFFYIPPEFCY